MRLIDNPLMLTTVCILYHDGGVLPGQRAELYKKFVNNLLCRRFDEPEKVHRFLMDLEMRSALRIFKWSKINQRYNDFKYATLNKRPHQGM